MPEQVKAYLVAGMDAHLGKPIDSSALIQTVLDWSSRSAANTAAALKAAI
jgi:CheY-like chemotaxis protein